MKTFKWKRLGFMLAILAILMGNLIGISAVATEDGNSTNMTGTTDPPDGVLVGYMPSQEKVKTGEHYEYAGWVGVPIYRITVIEYSFVPCCKKTYRAMDGCKGLKICGAVS
ncbi:MAG: hypothetical protein NTV01_19400 [Bacteroidia bacterium]|nr:hypothetical protein [Bacteroidia bacterium]